MLLSVPPFAPVQMPLQWNPALDRPTVNDARKLTGRGGVFRGFYNMSPGV
jgi:hypothetical protein